METKLTDGLLPRQPRFQINIPLTDQIRFQVNIPPNRWGIARIFQMW